MWGCHTIWPFNIWWNTYYRFWIDCVLLILTGITIVPFWTKQWTCDSHIFSNHIGSSQCVWAIWKQWLLEREWKCNRKRTMTQKSLCWSWSQSRIWIRRFIETRWMITPLLCVVGVSHKNTFVNICPLQVLPEKLYMLISSRLQSISSIEWSDSSGFTHCMQLRYPNLWVERQIQHFPVRIQFSL